MKLTVAIPAHNPHPERLTRVLDALEHQTLPRDSWELLVIDNASSSPVAKLPLIEASAQASRLSVHSAQPAGLTIARKAAATLARGEFLVFVDDDNVLAPDYLAQVVALFEAHPKLGAIGGKSLPEFEQPRPAWWQPEFDGLIACRDLGEAPQIAADCRDPQNGRRLYPHFAPLGAGLALRRSALQAWLDDPRSNLISDRRGSELTSGGDNDIVLTLLRAGWQVGYFSNLVLTHLIPAARVQRDYLARLNRAIAKSWIQILQQHDANPWPPIAPWTVSLRQLKASLVYRAWSGPAQYIRWQGACGHFEGRAAISKIDRSTPTS